MDDSPDWIARARAHWQWRGEGRPPFAEPTGPGQVSVWDFPRPPRIESEPRTVEIHWGERLLARTTRALRVLETSHPPTVYIPWADVDRSLCEDAGGGSLCEWKGPARYWSLVTDAGRLERVGWSYPKPFAAAAPLQDHVAFYPAPLHCTVGGLTVQPQPGGFYGGWITPELVGPFKGAPGSQGW
jgi:uncharacterized protein (DUF427 family)